MNQPSRRPVRAQTYSHAAPLLLHRIRVPSAWVDYNGHMSEWCYLLAMGDSSDAFFRLLGIDEAYRAAGASLYTVETHITNLREVTEGEDLQLTLHVLAADQKRIHVLHEILRPDGSPVATGEQLLLHVDTRSGRVCPLEGAPWERLRGIRESHSRLPRPEWVGHVIQMPGLPAPVGRR